MEKAAEYWRAVEWTFGFRGVAYYWLQRLGDQKTRLLRHMRPTGGVAAGMPCIKPFGCGCEHEVRSWKGKYFAVPMDEDARCETFDIKPEYIVIHEMKTDALLREAFEVLDVQPGELRETAFAKAFHVGCWQPQGGTLLQVYLTIPSTAAQFSAAAMGLLATVETPFVFLALSMKHLDQVAVAALARHKCPFLTMDKLVAPDDEGNLLLVKRLPEAETSGATKESKPENVFRYDGATWTISYGGKVVHLSDTKGFHYIIILLHEPGRVWSIEDLLCEVGNGSGSPVVDAHAGPVLDKQALREYRARLKWVQEQIDEATVLKEWDRVDKLDEEKGVLQHELAVAIDSQGRPRTTGKEAEKASDAVSKAIRRSISLIRKKHPSLARHLNDSINRGYSLSYEPVQPVVWQID